MSKQSIELKGVRVHNLKNIDLIHYMQKDKDVTWKVCLPMPVNFWGD